MELAPRARTAVHSREANEPSKTLRATEAPTQKAAGAITPAQHGATAHAPALKGRSAAMAPQLPPLTRLHPLLHSTSKAALAKGLFESLRFPNSGAGAAAKFVRLAHSEAHPTSRFRFVYVDRSRSPGGPQPAVPSTAYHPQPSPAVPSGVPSGPQPSPSRTRASPQPPQSSQVSRAARCSPLTSTPSPRRAAPTS